MDNYEKSELFKLIEQRFKRKYLNGESITEADFVKLGLTPKDHEEFMNLYVPSWEHQLFWKDELEKEDLNSLKIPQDSAFYNFGVKNIDILNFKLLLKNLNRIISIHKPSGQVFSSFVNENAILYGGYSKDEINDFISIEIKSFEDFFRDLEVGKINDILSVRLFEKRFYHVPENIDLFIAQKVLDLYLFASLLEAENEVMAFEEDKGWWTYRNLAELVDPEDDDLLYSKEAQIFTIRNPGKIHSELINGNLNILSEIKLKRNFWD